MVDWIDRFYSWTNYQKANKKAKTSKILSSLNDVINEEKYSCPFFSLLPSCWLWEWTNDLPVYGSKGLDMINELFHIENKHRADNHGTALLDIGKPEALPDFRMINNLYKIELVGYTSPIRFPNDGNKFVAI